MNQASDVAATSFPASNSAAGECAAHGRPWSSGLIHSAQVASYLAALITLLACIGGWYWLFDLFTHFRVQLVCFTSIPLLLFLAIKKWKQAALPTAVLAFNAIYLAPLLPISSAGAGPAECRIVAANVEAGNANTQAFLDCIRAEKPDLFVAMEIDSRWRAALRELEDEYPYRADYSRDGSFGIVLFSKLPIASQRVEFLGGLKIPTIVATVGLDGNELQVVGTHTLPPISATQSARRDAHLRGLAELARGLPRPLVVVGDLNTSSWSPHFQALVDRSRLRDSRSGFGIQPTWPNAPWLLQIPIDHALVSDDVVVVDRRVGASIGSDHRPIIVEISIAD